jgi:lysophospholipase L1-like esterase
MGDSLAAGYGASTGSRNFAALVSRYVKARRPGFPPITTRKYGAWTVDLWDVSEMLASRRARLLSRDGIHPNDEGYAVMAAVTFPMINRALRLDNGSARP